MVDVKEDFLGAENSNNTSKSIVINAQKDDWNEYVLQHCQLRACLSLSFFFNFGHLISLGITILA